LTFKHTLRLAFALSPILVAGSLVEASAGQRGLASWYQLPSRTACGERMSGAATAAHRSYPCGTRLLVTNLANGKTVTVRVNDRGPFKKARIVDVSKSAGQQLGLINRGIAPVSVAVID